MEGLLIKAARLTIYLSAAAVDEVNFTISGEVRGFSDPTVAVRASP